MPLNHHEQTTLPALILCGLIITALVPAHVAAQSTAAGQCQSEHQEATEEARETYIAESQACGGKTKCLKEATKKQAKRLKELGIELRECQGAKRDASRDPKIGGVTENVAGTEETYNPDYGKKLPAMTGSTWVDGVELFVSTRKGRRVGQGFGGSVTIRSNPARFSRARGFIDSTSSFKVTELWDLAGKPVPLNDGGIAIPITPK